MTDPLPKSDKVEVADRLEARANFLRSQAEASFYPGACSEYRAKEAAFREAADMARAELSASPTPAQSDAWRETVKVVALDVLHNMDLPNHTTPSEDCVLQAQEIALRLAALPAPVPSVEEGLRAQGQREGWASAQQWLRDRSAQRPPATLHHAAMILADQMDGLARAALASPVEGAGK